MIYITNTVYNNYKEEWDQGATWRMDIFWLLFLREWQTLREWSVMIPQLYDDTDWVLGRETPENLHIPLPFFEAYKDHSCIDLR